MGPTPEACLELLRTLRSLFQLKHALVMRIWQDDYGLHPAAGGLLGEIAQRGEVRTSDLALHRAVDPSVISRQVAQLVRAGLVSRRPAPTDGRVTLLSATAKGAEALRRWQQAQAEFVQQAMAGWDDSEVMELSKRVEAAATDLWAALRPAEPSGDAPQASDTSASSGVDAALPR
ncbi:MarR family winged helix-turn-helix transcriptional regulator [Gandjariella thermophila]|uniref:MarR family transcriptional regulator n=1 Tax=Gandjariella thermophila TaxID=1931992 RepID=A0A4D4J8U4_9PSEU|nr:MarR family winged helix-turn-helix transcriptional regulator [Gandjariella thermophila]GDY33245.1 MarR family transcriptional regulator [Gandjariella thermophila]